MNAGISILFAEVCNVQVLEGVSFDIQNLTELQFSAYLHPYRQNGWLSVNRLGAHRTSAAPLPKKRHLGSLLTAIRTELKPDGSGQHVDVPRTVDRR